MAEIGTFRQVLEPRGYDWSLRAGIGALRLKFRLRSQRGGMEEKKEKEKEEEKFPHMCESIGHRPLRGGCPSDYHTPTYTH